MTASQRLQALVTHLNTNVKSLADLCGYDRPQAFYDILKGKTRNISPTVCERLMTVLPRLNRVWLLTGEGEMLLTSEESSPATAKEVEEKTQEETGSAPKVKMVPLVELAASAGPIHTYYEEGVQLERCPKLPSPSQQADLAVPVSGDSMEPLFPDGAILFIKRINEAAFIPWGQALVLDTENGVFVKRVLPDGDNELYVWAESVNPKYPRMHVPKDAIYALYRVLAYNKPFYVG